MLDKKHTELLETFKKAAEEIIAKDGYAEQILFVFDESREFSNAFVLSGKNQTEVAEIVKRASSRFPVVLFVSEAWTSIVTTENALTGNYVRPADDPNRVEALVISLFVEGKRHCVSAPILRNFMTYSKKSLGEWGDILEERKKESLASEVHSQSNSNDDYKGFYVL